jgi:uncharacterized protein YndB with AHSA1/START domain
MNETRIAAQPGTPFLDVTREFDAAPAQVFRAWTEPELVAQWLGPHDMKMEILEYDARTGGNYRYIHRNDERGEARFRGVFHTVTPDELIIQTFEWEGAPGEVSLDVVTFDDLGSRTRLRTHSVFTSVETRDAAVSGGMTRGLTESMDRLETLVGA